MKRCKLFRGIAAFKLKNEQSDFSPDLFAFDYHLVTKYTELPEITIFFEKSC